MVDRVGYCAGWFSWIVGCLVHSGAAHLRNTLPLRYCDTMFLNRAPPWKLPLVGGVADMVSEGSEGVGLIDVQPGAAVLNVFRAAAAGAGGCCVAGAGGFWRGVRKTHCPSLLGPVQEI